MFKIPSQQSHWIGWICHLQREPAPERYGSLTSHCLNSKVYTDFFAFVLLLWLKADIILHFFQGRDTW